MKGLAITNIGIEETTSSEIKELIGAKTQSGNGFVIFDTKKFDDFFTLCYKSQSILKIILILDEFKINDIDDIKSPVEKLDLKDWLDDSTFVVRTGSRDSNLIKSEIEVMTGEFIFEKYKAKVNLENPDTTFFVFVNKNQCFFGIDFSGGDLGKREYRIFRGAETLKPTVAYALMRISGFKAEESLLDPFCNSGTIPIETALYAKKMPVNYFNKDKFFFLKLKKFEKFDFEALFDKEDKKIKKFDSKITAADPSFHAIASTKKNAKIADVEKDLNFSRKESEWLDVKFKEHELDRIVSFPPQKSKLISEKKIEKIYNELFYQADFILTNKGTVTLLLKETKIAEIEGKKYGYKLKSKQKIMQGHEDFMIVVFQK